MGAAATMWFIIFIPLLVNLVYHNCIPYDLADVLIIIIIICITSETSEVTSKTSEVTSKTSEETTEKSEVTTETSVS